tara:strand:+ start:128 stop:796 length:669 start_codon:yes stop_codon:yes gene_type:complete
LFIFIPKDLLIDNKNSINKYIMNFLSIDCSTDKGSLFVKTKNKTFNVFLQSDKYNNDLLMKQILDFFSKNNIKFDDISYIFVNQGPGNFSSLRGSLAVAKGISLSKNLKLFGYNTFLWSCAKFFNKKDAIYCLTKFRQKYFIKKFEKNLSVTSEVMEISENEIIQKYDKNLKIITENSAKNFEDKILKLNNLSIVHLDHNELEFLKLKDLLDEDYVKPLYLP